MICIINSCDLIYRLVNPQLPTDRVYVTNLKYIEFPLSFRICLNYHFYDKRYNDMGYYYDLDFFMGKSMYNTSLVGWNGHTKNGSIIAETEGTQVFF